MTSFIIIFHPSRLENLRQTLRFLEARESQLGELILVCQTECQKIPTFFCQTKQINMGLESYHKPLMTNTGVDQASGDIIVLLDSDRVLPENYFTKTTNTLKPNQVIAPEPLYQLLKPYSDGEIQEGKIEKKYDFRNKDNRPQSKNLFAGNTVLFKENYLKLGGYDESYIGYGYADSDMTMKAMQELEIIWTDDEELHLYHRNDIYWENQSLSYQKFKIMTAINGLRYHEKWNLILDGKLLELLISIEKDLPQYPEGLRKIFSENRKNITLL